MRPSYFKNSFNKYTFGAKYTRSDSFRNTKEPERNPRVATPEQTAKSAHPAGSPLGCLASNLAFLYPHTNKETQIIHTIANIAEVAIPETSS